MQKKSINLMYILGYYPSIGGVESITTNLSNEFVKLGMNVHIISFGTKCNIERMGLNRNVKIKVFNRPVYSKTNKQLLREYIRKNDINIVFNQWCLPFFVTKLISYAIKRTNCKFVQIHQNLPTTNARLKKVEIDIEEGKGLLLINKLKWHLLKIASRISLKYAYAKCDKFSMLSRSFVEPFKEFIWENEEKKIWPIWEAFDSSADGSMPTKEKELLYLGRIDYNQKRVRRVIDIWNDLEYKHPDWHLTIVGDGPDMPIVKKMVADYGLKRVYFEGFQKADKYFRRAPIMLLVSEYEGFGIVLAEAQSYGCVPIALDSYSALHDIVEDKKNGRILSYPYNRASFVNVVSETIENKKIRNEMALNGIESVKKFSLPQIVNEWVKLINELMS